MPPNLAPAWAQSLRHHPAFGQDTPAQQILTPSPVWTALSAAGTVIGAYHGYVRNDSVGWGIAWALLGGLFPLIVIPVAYAQGVGERA